MLTYAAGFRPSRDTTFALSFCGLLLLGPQSGVHRPCTTATRFSRPLPLCRSPDNLQALSPVMGLGLDPSQTRMSHAFSAQSALFPPAAYHAQDCALFCEYVIGIHSLQCGRVNIIQAIPPYTSHPTLYMPSHIMQAIARYTSHRTYSYICIRTHTYI